MEKQLYQEWQRAFAEWMLHKTEETAQAEICARKRLLVTKREPRRKSLAVPIAA